MRRAMLLFGAASLLAGCNEDTRELCSFDFECAVGDQCVLGVCRTPPDGGIDPFMPRDAGSPPPPDAGFPPPPRDAGPPPPPRDAGPPPPQGCRPGLQGVEGCPCTSNISPNDTAFLQDDCRAGLLCVPFDLLSGRQDLIGPVQSCVRPCASDAECGAGRRCVDSGFDANTGAERICVDRVVEYDEFCGFADSFSSRIPDVTLETAGEQVGCAPGLECTIGVFSDLHPDEGVCLDLCTSDAECAMPTPYCNPEVFVRNGDDGQPQPVGVCSLERFGQGALCGDPNPRKVGFASQCDTSPRTPDNTFCVPIGGLTPDGQGICMTACDELGMFGPCTGVEPDGTPQTCSGSFFTTDIGVCTSGCSNYPDTCGGPGAYGLGRFCMAYLADTDQNPVGLCMDRRPPALTAATFDDEGNVADQGDNCFAAGGSARFTQCPEPAYCEVVDFNQGVGLCVIGCEGPGDPMSNQYCSDALGTQSGVCADVFTGGGPMTDSGLCGDSNL